MALLVLFTATMPAVWCQIRCATVDGHHAAMMGEMAPCHGQHAVLSLPSSMLVNPALPAAAVTLPPCRTVRELAEPETAPLPTGVPDAADPPPPRPV